MELYEGMGQVDVVDTASDLEDHGKVQSLLELREIEEQLHQQLHAVHELMSEMKLENGERKEIVGKWMECVRQTVSSITDVRPEEIVSRN